MYIYRMYITKNGHRIYRKNRRPFRFWVDDVNPDLVREA